MVYSSTFKKQKQTITYSLFDGILALANIVF